MLVKYIFHHARVGGQSNGLEYENDASATTAAANGQEAMAMARATQIADIALGASACPTIRSTGNGISVKQSDSATTCARIRLSGSL
jgi:hypothetical protein